MSSVLYDIKRTCGIEIFQINATCLKSLDRNMYKQNPIPNQNELTQLQHVL